MFYVVTCTLVVICTAIVVGTKAQSNEILNVTVTADPPVNTRLCEDDIITLTCRVSNVTQPSYKWSSTKLNITEQSNSIEIVATIITIQYYCTVFDAATNKSGEGRIAIANSNISPVLHKTNFGNALDVEEEGSVNLTVEVFSNMSLTPEIHVFWSGPGGLPENAVVTYYVINGINYASLGFNNIVVADTANYSLTAMNECGSSILYVYIDVKEHNNAKESNHLVETTAFIFLGTVICIFTLLYAILYIKLRILKVRRSRNLSKNQPQDDCEPLINKKEKLESNCEFVLPESEHITMSGDSVQFANSTTENTASNQQTIHANLPSKYVTIETEELIQNSDCSEKTHDKGRQNVKWWSNSTENSSLNHDLPQSINAVKYSDESSWNSTGVSSIMNDVQFANSTTENTVSNQQTIHGNLPSKYGTIETEALIQSSNSSATHCSDKIHDYIGRQNVKWWSNSTENSSMNPDIPQSINAVKYSDEFLCNPAEVSSTMNDDDAG